MVIHMSESNIFGIEYWRVRQKHREDVKNLVERFISDPRRDYLVELAKKLWSVQVFTNKEWFVDNFILKEQSPGEVAGKLKLVLDETRPLRDRLRIRIQGMRIGMISEILFCFYPDKYAPMNKRSVKSLVDLGYLMGGRKSYESFLSACNRFLSDILKLKQDVERKVGFKIPNFDFVDGVLESVFKGEILIEFIRNYIEQSKPSLRVKSIEDASFNYALGAIQGAVKIYFYWLKKGDSPEVAIGKAVSYALGVIQSSGVFWDPNNRDKFIWSLKLVQLLVSKLLQLISEQQK